MNWLASQNSFLLTFEILECKYLVPRPGAGADVSAISSLSSDFESKAAAEA